MPSLPLNPLFHQQAPFCPCGTESPFPYGQRLNRSDWELHGPLRKTERYLLWNELQLGFHSGSSTYQLRILGQVP